MKTLLFTLFVLVSWSTLLGQQRSTDEVSGLIFQLEEKHKALFTLPHSEDFVRDVIVPEITAEREVICPNFPQRGEEHEDGAKGLFREWIKNHREEYDDYILYLNEVLRKYAA